MTSPKKVLAHWWGGRHLRCRPLPQAGEARELDAISAAVPLASRTWPDHVPGGVHADAEHGVASRDEQGLQIGATESHVGDHVLGDGNEIHRLALGCKH